MLTTNEAQTLTALVDTRDYPYESLTPQLEEIVKSLRQKKMVTVEEGLVSASAQGVTLVKIFKSGLDFDVLYRRLPFRSLTKLLHSGFDKCFNDGIHLNVIFRNMPQEQLDLIKNEIAIAEEAKSG